MKHSFLFWCGSCLSVLSLAQGAWAQTNPSLLFPQNPNDPNAQVLVYRRAAARPSMRLATASVIASTATEGSPYQHWRQVHAPRPKTEDSGNATYTSNRRGSHWIEELLEELPFQLEQGGISLGDNSPFFLHPRGLGYQHSY
ncbi:MAG: hypothetical protein Q6L60_01865 [Thermostichus sp. HHBFW_bins_43]